MASVGTRRTPALTAEVRRRFEVALLDDGWQPGATIPKIADAVGLTSDQVRDAIFGESADKWRRDLSRRIAGGASGRR